MTIPRFSRAARLFISCTLVAASACHRADKSATDSALATDLTLANQAGAVQPQLQDTALNAAPAPAARAPVTTQTHRTPERTASTSRATQAAPAPAPAPAPLPAPAPAPVGPSIAAGTSVGLVTTSTVCSGGARPGDKFVATTTAPMTATDGSVIPSGTKVVVEVASVASAAKAEDATISFRVRAIATTTQRYTPQAVVVAAVPLQRVRTTSRSTDAKKVAGGAAAGAIVGQVMGKDTKGTLIGAAAGAVLGGAIAAKTSTYDACLPSGASLTLTLTEPLFVNK